MLNLFQHQHLTRPLPHRDPERVQGDSIRHAELVSATCLSTGDDLLLGKPIRSQVAKFWILWFYKVPLPGLMPVLQLLLSVNNILHPLDFFKIHKICQMVSGSEYRTATALVLKDPSLQVARHPDVKCGSVLIAQDVHKACLHDYWLS